MARIEAVLLGVAQDAGLPQAACDCVNCSTARIHGHHPYVVSIGIIDHTEQRYWMVDASPDFPMQLQMLRERAPRATFAGLILTHAHMGHYTGLVHLGRESMDIRGLGLWCSRAMQDFLCSNAPWARLLDDGNVVPQEIRHQQTFMLGSEVEVTPWRVPHRAEFTDTYAFLLRGAGRQVFYCPDIDSWDGLTLDLDSILAAGDVALMDGSFFSADELTHRDITLVPHPVVSDTVNRYGSQAFTLILVHLNHTNPLWRPGHALTWLEGHGVAVGRRGQVWTLSR